jgi:hypothetical protein
MWDFGINSLIFDKRHIRQRGFWFARTGFSSGTIDTVMTRIAIGRESCKSTCCEHPSTNANRGFAKE